MVEDDFWSEMNEYTKKRKIKKLLQLLQCGYIRRGYKRAEYLKKFGIFKEFGEKCYWFTRKIPAEPMSICIEDNVNIATGVYFCDYYVIHHMLNHCNSALKLSSGREYTYKNTISILRKMFLLEHIRLLWVELP